MNLNKKLCRFEIQSALLLVTRTPRRRYLKWPDFACFRPGVLNQSVASEDHKSVHVQGRKRKCVQCIKAGERTMKGHKVNTCFECSLCKVEQTCMNCFAFVLQFLF